ncbi:MAG: hypothetical protein QM601_08080 [Pseudoxanthomonas sp.]
MSLHWPPHWIRAQKQQGEPFADWLASLPEPAVPKGVGGFAAACRRQPGSMPVRPARASVADRRAGIVPPAGEKIP